MADTFETLKGVIVDTLSVDADKVTPEANFKDDLDADSLSMVEFTMGLEDAFGITLEDSDTAGVNTVDDAVKLIEAKQSA